MGRGNGDPKAGDGNGDGWMQTLANAALPAVFVGILAGLTALGIEGDLLTRLVRNSPGKITLALALGIVAILLPAVARPINRPRWTTVLGVVAVMCLGIGTGVATWAGADSVGEREQPTVDLDAVAEESTEETVVVEASAQGLSLATEDHMLLRVVAFPQDIGAVDAWVACRDVAKIVPPDYSEGVVLYSGETGPTATGTTDNSVRLAVPRAEYRFVCAHSVLSGRPDVVRWPFTLEDNSGRLSSVLLDVTRVPVPPDE